MNFEQIKHEATLLGKQPRIGFARYFIFAASLCFALIFLFSATIVCADSVDWPTLGFTQVVANTFSHPTVITHAGDGSDRLFVVEQSGRIRIVQTNSVIPQPFLDITSRVLSAGAEQGLLGLAFPSGFSTNNHFYVDYNRQADGALVISRFFLTTTNSNVADTNSEQIIKVISKSFNNHNGGQIAFGPDGYLYIGVGDGGSEGDPQNNGQKTNTLLGKLLRIDVESGVSPYAIPTNNPFVGNGNFAPEIWALGLRNPWRFSFDRLTGDLYIGDVGQNRFEEIDFQPAGSLGGQNYGWKIMEGPTNYTVPTGFTNFSALTKPVAWYDHFSLPTDAAGSVTGGSVYRGPSVPRMDGIYFYGDFMAGWILGLKQVGTNWQSITLVTNSIPLPPTHFWISTFGEDDPGQIYMADYYAGKIYQIQDSLQVWTPTFSPASGTINSNMAIVSCVTTGAVIHYTSSGIDPTASDPIVASGGTIQVTTGITNKLRAFRSDLSASGVARAIFTNKVGTPFFSPPSPVTNGTSIIISTITFGATIYYTTNGTTPTTSSLIYSLPVTITKNVTLKALGVENGYSNSVVATASYSIAQVATPVFNPPLGPITNGTSISIACSTSGSTIYYTFDGSTPTTNSPVYLSPVTISGGTTLKAFAIANAYVDSSVRSVLFSLVQTATPVFNPFSGPITNGTSITITCATPSSTIFYTVDGSPPTTNSLIYSSPLILSGPVTLMAMAYRDDLSPSSVNSIFYGIKNLENTVVSTLANGFSSPRSVCIDQIGNLYVGNVGSSSIRKISPSGQVTTVASISSPTGVCIDSMGNLYVGDGSCSLVWKIDTNGTSTLLATVQGCNHISSLGQLETDSAGNVYVGFFGSVQKITPDGTVTLFGGPECSGCTGWAIYVGVGIDLATNIYATTANDVWRIAPDGTTTLIAGGQAGYSDGSGLTALFQSPQDATVDFGTNIFMSDVTTIRKIRSDGWVSTMAGTGVSGYQNGRGSVAQFNGAAGLCVDTNGNIFVADSGNNCIRKISPDTAGIGIADDWQRANFGYVGIDPNADTDHDGMSNYSEFWAGTNPLDSSSVLAIDRTAFFNNGYGQIRWQTVAGKTYNVQYSSDLVSWSNLGNSVQGDGSIATVSDPSPISQNGQRYYRVVIIGL